MNAVQFFHDAQTDTIAGYQRNAICVQRFNNSLYKKTFKKLEIRLSTIKARRQNYNKMSEYHRGNQSNGSLEEK